MTSSRGVRAGLLLASLLPVAGARLGAEDYVLGPDSLVQPGVPKGELTKRSWTSRVFPGTTRDYWVYVPKQYDASKPAAVMVFQDGAGYVREDGNWRVPVVFDNLIHKGEMPVTVGVFVNPGVVPAASEQALPRFNRSLEYDSVDDRYARFLLEELLPEIGKSLNLVQDGNGRAIAGASSGAICAFNVAWHRPDQFSRVFSTIGAYVGLRGGHTYPTLVRKTEPKPLRVFTHVRFAFDKSALDMQAQDTLDREVVVRFGEFSNLRFININGYTDRIGSVQYNQKLSERRAAAVKAYLVRQGADANKIETTGFGKMYAGSTLPFVECTQKERKALIACLAPNRRAEVEVLGTGR